MIRSLLYLLVLFASAPLHAEVDGHTLLKYQQEADAFNADKPEAHRYRAGFFYGYLNGVLDAVNNKSVCFTACRCELETLLSQHYLQYPADLNKPAGPVLARLFEQHYPCKKP